MKSLSLHRIGRPLAMLAPALVSAGCAVGPVNPSFSVTAEQADHDLQRIAAHPRKLERPLLIISGLLDPGFAAWALNSRFDSLFDHPCIVAVSIGEKTTLEACRRKVIDAVQRRLASPNASETVEMDVIGFSLGGLVARYSALPPVKGGPRLKIARLFTISSPNSGSERAQNWPLLHPIQRDLRAGSTLYAKLDAAKNSYEIFPYIRLGDRTIGESYAAPRGQSAWWVSTPALCDAHNGAYGDPRILADIARRLRGETPWASTPASPLPADK